MSLLMDALRRAEADKKQAEKSAAGKAPDEDDLASTVKLNRPPIPPIPPAEAASNRRAGTTSSDTHDNTAPQSESPNAASGLPLDVEDFSIHAAVGDENQIRGYQRDMSALSLEPLSTAYDEGGALAQINDDNNTTVPTPTAAQAQLNSYFDDSQAVDPAEFASESTAGGAADELPAGQTAVNAHTVFEAGNPSISRRMIVWMFVVGVAFLSLLVIAGIYYFQQAPTARSIPSPNIVTRLETRPTADTASENAIPAPTITEPEAPAAAPDPAALSINAEIAASTYVADEAANNGSDKRLTSGTVPARGGVSVLNEKTTTNRLAVTDESVSTPVTATVRPQSMDSAETPTVHAKSVKISRSRRGAAVKELTNKAYIAYQSGDLASAKTLYSEAIEIRRDNTDALNGLAAIALSDGDIESAHRHYTEVLRVDPDNPTASAAVFQIEGGVGNRVTESQLKLMLDKGGNRGHINFALGNLYSRNNRWNDAQLAFFEAVRHSPSNPDYLYNLAVSLDQIGQHNAARDYYQQALDGSDEAKVGFDAAAVLARIQAIGQSAGSAAP